VHDGEEEAAQRVAEHQRELHRDARQREGVPVVVLRHEVGEGGRPRRLERRGCETGEEGQHEQDADGDVEQHHEEQRRSRHVGGEHDRHPPVAVGEGGQHLSDAHVPGQRHAVTAAAQAGRTGALEHEHGEGESARPVSEQEIMSAAQRRRKAGRRSGDSSAVVRRRRSPRSSSGHRA
jgi:hypothetical protein